MATEKSPAFDDEVFAPVLSLYEQPISRATIRSGWLLILASALSIASTTFGLKFKQFFGFFVDDSPSANFSAVFLLLVLALTFPHFLNAATDALRKKDLDNHVRFLVGKRKLKWLQNRRNQAINEMHPPNDDEADPDPMFQEIYAESEAHERKWQSITSTSMDKIVSTQWPMRLRNFRFWIQVTTPVLIAVLAVWIGRHQLAPAFQQLWKHV